VKTKLRTIVAESVPHVERLINFNTQAEMTVRTSANLKAEILSREYRLAMLRKTSGLRTIEAQKLLDEKRELENQLKIIEAGLDLNHKGSKKKQKNSGQYTPMNVLPNIGFQYLRLKRDTLILEKVFELLTQQFELAKIEEVKDEISFQIIDKAIKTQKRYRPRILVNTALSVFLGLLIGLTIIFIKEKKYMDVIKKFDL